MLQKCRGEVYRALAPRRRMDRPVLRVLLPGLSSATRATSAGAAGDSAAARPGSRVAVLDGWRGISILLVIASHLVSYRYAEFAPASPEARVWEVLATFGVCVFFVISGFIIVRLALQERETEGRFHAGAFYIRRCFRILPPYFLYLAFVLAASALGLISQPERQTLPAFVFACNLPSVKCGWFTGHSWSLAYEEQFYILLPLLMLWARVRPLLATLTALLVGFPLLTRFVLHAGHASFVLGHAAHYFSFIAIGALAAAHAQLLKRWASSRHADWITVAAVVALGCALWLEVVARDPAGIARYGNLETLFVPVMEPVSIAWIVCSSVYRSGPSVRLLCNPVLQVIGAISFSLYLWQEAFSGEPAFYPTRSALLFAPLMFVCAVLSYRLIERPFIKWGRTLAARPAGVAPAAAANAQAAADNPAASSSARNDSRLPP